MSVKLKAKSGDQLKRAYVLMKAVEQLQAVSGGINTPYGAEQCNRLIDAARQVAADDPVVLGSLSALKPLQFEFGMGRWLAAEANTLLAELNGILRAFIDLNMDPDEKKRLGLVG